MDKANPRPPSRRPAICVFCGSSHGRTPAYTETARQFGALLAEHGFDLVFGGGGVGLMGEVAASAAASGGRILGVIPSFLRHLEPPSHAASRIVVTETMNDRKARMFEAAAGFAVLPGGLGTLDEFSEAVTYAQLDLHDKPIVLVNAGGFFSPLLAFIDHFIAEGFAAPEVRKLFQVAATPEEAIRLFEHLRVTA